MPLEVLPCHEALVIQELIDQAESLAQHLALAGQLEDDVEGAIDVLVGEERKLRHHAIAPHR